MTNDIYAYYQQIEDGTIPVGEWVRLAYRYVIHGLESGEFTFDQKKASRAIRFIESFCHHSEGSLAPQLLRLELWQRACVSVIFGILDHNGNRQFREVPIVVGRKTVRHCFYPALLCTVYSWTVNMVPVYSVLLPNWIRQILSITIFGRLLPMNRN